MECLAPCKHYEDRAASLEAQIRSLQEELRRAPPGHKPAMIQMIVEAKKELDEVTDALSHCRGSPPSNLRILGVERTQATQYFNFNGQGSGLADDNSIPAVRHKALILRVYVGRASSASRPSRISGVVSYVRPNKQSVSVGPVNGPIAPLESSEIDRSNSDHTLTVLIPPLDCVGTRIFFVCAHDADRPDEAAAYSLSERITIMFKPVPNPRIHGVLIHYTRPGMDIPAPSPVELVDTLVFTGQVFPISSIEYTGC
jgi:hypothetical protein